MQRYFIITINCAWLALLLIGLPAATRAQFGNWEIARASTERLLLFWGLAFGVIGNVFAGIAIVKGRKGKILSWEWTAVFIGLLLVCWGFAHGSINFQWLKQALLWMQSHF